MSAKIKLLKPKEFEEMKLTAEEKAAALAERMSAKYKLLKPKESEEMKLTAEEKAAALAERMSAKIKLLKPKEFEEMKLTAEEKAAALAERMSAKIKLLKPKEFEEMKLTAEEKADALAERMSAKIKLLKPKEFEEMKLTAEEKAAALAERMSAKYKLLKPKESEEMKLTAEEKAAALAERMSAKIKLLKPKEFEEMKLTAEEKAAALAERMSAKYKLLEPKEFEEMKLTAEEKADALAERKSAKATIEQARSAKAFINSPIEQTKLKNIIKTFNPGNKYTEANMNKYYSEIHARVDAFLDKLEPQNKNLAKILLYLGPDSGLSYTTDSLGKLLSDMTVEYGSFAEKTVGNILQNGIASELGASIAGVSALPVAVAGIAKKGYEARIFYDKITGQRRERDTLDKIFADGVEVEALVNKYIFAPKKTTQSPDATKTDIPSMLLLTLAESIGEYAREGRTTTFDSVSNAIREGEQALDSIIYADYSKISTWYSAPKAAMGQINKSVEELNKIIIRFPSLLPLIAGGNYDTSARLDVNQRTAERWGVPKWTGLQKDITSHQLYSEWVVKNERIIRETISELYKDDLGSMSDVHRNILREANFAHEGEYTSGWF